jgi:hypothetical protein
MLNDLFAEFKSLPVAEKADFILALEKLNLGYDINYQSLAEVWTRIAEAQSPADETEA